MISQLDRFRRYFFLAVFLTFCGYALWEAFNYSPTPPALAHSLAYWQKAQVPLDSLNTGDLVLRRGKGFVSEYCRQFNTRDKKYSHSGILHKEGELLYVYNIIGGESRISNKMKKERLEIFCHPLVAFEFAVYRYDLNHAEKQELDSLLGKWYQQGLEFDLDFDYETDETMYCSEMIFKAISYVKNDTNYLPLSQVNQKAYVALDDLYFHSHAKPLIEYRYDQVP